MNGIQTKHTHNGGTNTDAPQIAALPRGAIKQLRDALRQRDGQPPETRNASPRHIVPEDVLAAIRQAPVEFTPESILDAIKGRRSYDSVKGAIRTLRICGKVSLVRRSTTRAGVKTGSFYTRTADFEAESGEGRTEPGRVELAYRELRKEVKAPPVNRLDEVRDPIGPGYPSDAR